ncbi:MAG: PaaI family thioesterase, partial [Burkholderiaceae bacterium]
AGRRLIITTAEVHHVGDDGERTLCALMQQTIAPVPKTY